MRTEAITPAGQADLFVIMLMYSIREARPVLQRFRRLVDESLATTKL